jgi:hypothetical protein
MRLTRTVLTSAAVLAITALVTLTAGPASAATRTWRFTNIQVSDTPESHSVLVSGVRHFYDSGKTTGRTTITDSVAGSVTVLTRMHQVASTDGVPTEVGSSDVLSSPYGWWVLRGHVTERVSYDLEGNVFDLTADHIDYLGDGLGGA